MFIFISVLANCLNPFYQIDPTRKPTLHQIVKKYRVNVCHVLLTLISNLPKKKQIKIYKLTKHKYVLRRNQNRKIIMKER